MTLPAKTSGELRVLLSAATPKDGSLIDAILAKEGIATCWCPQPNDILHEMAAGAGALILAEELLQEPTSASVIAALKAQPEWSDLPVIVLARTGADSQAIARIMMALGSITVLERPTRIAAFISSVRAALAARKRQYVLRDTLEGLRESDQRKTEFLATLAHELRNPLAPMRAALVVLKRSEPDALQSHKLYDMMARQVDYMVRMVDDLLEVSRITRGKIELQVHPVDLLEVIRDAAEVSRPLAHAAGQELVLHLPAGEVKVAADEVRLVQVFANLINNASRYSPEGSRIEVDVARDGGEAEIVVRDHGIGIAPEMLDAVFEMFVQVAGPGRSAQGGLGIGLTLVRKLVEMHGGTVTAQSAGCGAGSVFKVRLPVREMSEPQAMGASSLLDISNHRVLIVDDNADAADSLASLISMLGAAVQVAYGAAEALQVVTKLEPTIGIIDVGMPGMDGCELATRLRAKPGTAGMYLVALTGWGQEADRLRVSAAGFNKHLLKPVDLDDLMAALADAP